MAGDGRLWWSSAAVDTSQLHSPVVHARRRSRRRVAAVVLAALGSVAGVTLLAVRGGGGGEAAAPSELTIRSANLVIRDLAKQWDAQHYGTQPFEFCGQKHLTQAQVKVCAENFLAMLGKEEGTPVRQWGFPELKAYSKCMSAQHLWQVRACIGVVTKRLTADNLVTLEKSGKSGKDKELIDAAQDAVQHARPDASVSGLDGGVNGNMAERATAAYIANHQMRPAPEGEAPGCELLGVDGCEINGGIDPQVKDKALEANLAK